MMERRLVRAAFPHPLLCQIIYDAWLVMRNFGGSSS
jgi:hypothetical protein